MKFDRPNDPRPMTAARAVRRGILCIYGPGGLFVFASSAFALAVVNLSLVCSAILWVLGLLAEVQIQWSCIHVRYGSNLSGRGALPSSAQKFVAMGANYSFQRTLSRYAAS